MLSKLSSKAYGGISHNWMVVGILLLIQFTNAEERPADDRGIEVRETGDDNYNNTNSMLAFFKLAKQIGLIDRKVPEEITSTPASEKIQADDHVESRIQRRDPRGGSRRLHSDFDLVPDKLDKLDIGSANKKVKKPQPDQVNLVDVKKPTPIDNNLKPKKKPDLIDEKPQLSSTQNKKTDPKETNGQTKLQKEIKPQVDDETQPKNQNQQDQKQQNQNNQKKENQKDKKQQNHKPTLVKNENLDKIKENLDLVNGNLGLTDKLDNFKENLGIKPNSDNQNINHELLDTLSPPQDKNQNEIKPDTKANQSKPKPKPNPTVKLPTKDFQDRKVPPIVKPNPVVPKDQGLDSNPRGVFTCLPLDAKAKSLLKDAEMVFELNKLALPPLWSLLRYLQRAKSILNPEWVNHPYLAEMAPPAIVLLKKSVIEQYHWPEIASVEGVSDKKLCISFYHLDRRMVVQKIVDPTIVQTKIS